MISQAILVIMMMLSDTGRCWESMSMPTCPARSGDQAISFPFLSSSACNLDHSSVVTCNHSYSPPKLCPDLGSMDAPDMLHGLLVNNSMPWDAVSKFSIINMRGSADNKVPVGVSNFRNVSEFPFGSFFGYSPGANLSCHEARKNASSFECRATNSECVDSRSGVGYHCICSTGFEGYPYLVDGCHDIDECLVSEPCVGTCTNLIGSYSCSCPPRFEGDGKKDGSGCYLQSRTSPFILFYILLGFVVPALAVSWIFWRHRRKKVVNLRRSLFRRNGGELLQAKQSIQKTLSILTAEDLKKATNNYDESNVLSQEHHLGITYKGILPGTNSGVTIQFCHAFERCKIEALVTKLVTLSQVSHRNVVRLLGCCLETQIPLLVYESITGKSLFDHINDDYLSWDVRLRIAADTAGALAYLHSATIIHGALSSSCILLDHGYTVKLKGFDLKCLNCSCVEPYPDLFSSGQLTEKSDVYSFGFILVELLTRKGVMSLDKVAKYILGSSRDDDELLEILDDSIVTDDNAGKLREVGEIAKTCLSSSSHERPTMKEVALALDECMKTRD